MKRKALAFTILGLVLSVGAGVAAVLLLSAHRVADSPSLKVGAAFVTVLALMVGIVIVEIVSVFKIDDSTFHTALIAGSLFATFALSTDMRIFLQTFGIAVPEFVMGISGEIAFILAAGCCCWFVTYTNGTAVEAKTAVGVALPVIAAFMVYSLTFVYGYGYIAHFAIVVTLSVAFCALFVRAEKRGRIGFTMYFTASLFCFVTGVQTVNVLVYGGVAHAVTGISLVYAVLAAAMFLIVYLLFAIRADFKAVRSVEYKHKAELYETKALSGQIKPHFIFNSLEALRSLYHRDLALGDAALGHLSDFLRGSIHSFDSELVPFETELDNVFSYTELENLKRRDKVEVIFDIDFTAFRVPPFSIQPFVENALKYSGVDTLENGRIIISSYKSGDCAVVEISDNGKGFDLSAVPESSHGIKNACGRFALALGTEPEIESKAGEGTRIKIVIKLQEAEREEEE